MHTTAPVVADLGLKIDVGVAVGEPVQHNRRVIILIIFIEFHGCRREQIPASLLLLLLFGVVFIDILINVRLRLAVLHGLLAEGQILLPVAVVVDLVLIAHTVNHEQLLDWRGSLLSGQQARGVAALGFLLNTDLGLLGDTRH